MDFNDKNIEKITFVDLFAGTSALSEGFVRCGFFPIAHIEMNSDACYTIKTRLSYHYLKESSNIQLYYKYLKGSITREHLYNSIPPKIVNSVINAEISDETIENIFNQIDSSTLYKQINRIDFIIGGPPCQAFSLLNRHTEAIETDPRCYLYLQYGKFLKYYRPKGFVFENVTGILSAKNEHFNNIRKHFKDIGYNVYYSILNASDFGVLQNRKRVIIYGWRDDMDKGCPILDTSYNKWTCKDIFSDLQQIRAGEEGHEYISPPNEYLLSTDIRTEKDILTQHLARPINKKDAEKYKLAIEMLYKNGARIKNTDFPETIRTIKNPTSFLDRFKVVDKSRKSHTIIAHISKDGHYYIYPYLDSIRSISVREAARLQSFPDNFYFEGSRSAIFKQIGNAVPPLMAYAIAKKIKELV
jgi:DNA (cytosine-5)-methyltransferase 1